jgi:endonuclease/exonuclease/phosphatase family metal-dependent hydrolase
VKLLQLNCWSGKLGTQLKRLEQETNPDIVCLQEAYTISPRPGSVFTPPSEVFPTEEYPYSVLGKFSSQRYMRELADFGNMTISKKPFVSEYLQYTSGEPIEDIDTAEGDSYNIRNFVHTVIEVDGKELHVLNHHGYHSPEGKDGSDESTRQLQIIADYMAALVGPIIFAGDMNLHPDSDSFQPINTLRNLPKEYEIESTRTELAKRQEVIDYIFVSDDVIVNNFYVSERIASDHKALILDFSL